MVDFPTSRRSVPFVVASRLPFCVWDIWNSMARALGGNLKTTAMFCSLFGGKNLIEVVAKQISSNSWIYIYIYVCVLVGVDCDNLMQFGKCFWWLFSEPIGLPNWRDHGMSMIELLNQSGCRTRTKSTEHRTQL